MRFRAAVRRKSCGTRPACPLRCFRALNNSDRAKRGFAVHILFNRALRPFAPATSVKVLLEPQG